MYTFPFFFIYIFIYIFIIFLCTSFNCYELGARVQVMRAAACQMTLMERDWLPADT